MPTKIWAIGEEVLAADFNSLVQEQVVATFASAAARATAIPSPKVGMTTHLADTGALEVWTNKTSPASWRPPWNTAWGITTNTTALPPNGGMGIGAQVIGGSTFNIPILGRRYHVHASLQWAGAPILDVACSVQPDKDIGAGQLDGQGIRTQATGTNRGTLSLDAIAIPTKNAQQGVLIATPGGNVHSFEGGRFWVADIGGV